jgi:hypothetical protein
MNVHGRTRWYHIHKSAVERKFPRSSSVRGNTKGTQDTAAERNYENSSISEVAGDFNGTRPTGTCIQWKREEDADEPKY